QKVKALRRSGRPLCLARGSVKRAAGERVSDYKDSGDARFLLRNRAQLPFAFRVEVISQIRSSEVIFQKFKAVAEIPNRDFEHRWEWAFSAQLKNVFILFVETVKDVGQYLSLDLNNILRPIDEANLEV